MRRSREDGGELIRKVSGMSRRQAGDDGSLSYLVMMDAEKSKRDI